MKKIVLMITAVLAIGLSVALMFVSKQDEQEMNKYTEWNEERRPLKVRQAELRRELEELEKNFELSRKHKGTTQVLFTDLNEQIYTECYPMMKEFKFTGVLALSPTKLPGASGCLTVEQFKELIDEGWTACITWDKDTSMKIWSEQLGERLGQMGVVLSQTVYFPKGSYQSSVDEQMKELGYSIAVYNEGEGNPLIQLQEEEGIWHLGAVGFMSQIPKMRLTECVAQKGNVVYLVGFELEHEKYVETSFRSMLGYFDSYEKNAELQVCNMEDARAHYRGRLNGVDAAEAAKYEAAKAPLEAELAELEEQLKVLKVN